MNPTSWISDPRLQKGTRFKSEVDGVPVIMEIDEVVIVDEGKAEAVLKAHVVGRYEPEEVRDPGQPSVSDVDSWKEK